MSFNPSYKHKNSNFLCHIFFQLHSIACQSKCQQRYHNMANTFNKGYLTHQGTGLHIGIDMGGPTHRWLGWFLRPLQFGDSDIFRSVPVLQLSIQSTQFLFDRSGTINQAHSDL